MVKKIIALSFLTLSLTAASPESLCGSRHYFFRAVPACASSGAGEKDSLIVGDYAKYDFGGKEVIMVPNIANSDSIKIKIRNKQAPKEAYLDAQELRLKARELTSQLLETWYPENIKDMVAYITTFTPQDNLRAETDFGQYLRQAFMYEFNQRGFAVRDFSARDLILNENGYAYGISDNSYKTSVLRKNAALVTGTFYRDEEYLFINVRLIRGTDGMVLRTAQTVIPVTPLVGRMTKVKPKPLPPVLPSAPITIVSGE